MMAVIIIVAVVAFLAGRASHRAEIRSAANKLSGKR